MDNRKKLNYLGHNGQNKNRKLKRFLFFNIIPKIASLQSQKRSQDFGSNKKFTKSDIKPESLSEKFNPRLHNICQRSAFL